MGQEGPSGIWSRFATLRSSIYRWQLSLRRSTEQVSVEYAGHFYVHFGYFSSISIQLIRVVIANEADASAAMYLCL